MSDDFGYQISQLQGRVDAHLTLIKEIRAEARKLRATIEEERSPSCQCSSSSSASPESLSSDDLKLGVRLAYRALSDEDGGMWLSREEILALLGERP